MSDAPRRTKIPAFVSNEARARIYEVVAAYASAGKGYGEALQNLQTAYKERNSETSEHISAIILRDGNRDLSAALLAVLSGFVAEERALLLGVPVLEEGGDIQAALRAASSLLCHAARIATAAS